MVAPPIATLPAGSVSFTDKEALKEGVRYEYKIKTGTNAKNTSYGYLAVGVKVPMIDNRGKVLLIVDKTMASGLEKEIGLRRTKRKGRELLWQV